MTHKPGELRVRVAAIIVQNGCILLARHEKNGRSYYVLPGGGVEYGESLSEALAREVYEEANLTIHVRKLVLVNDTIPPERHRHILNLYFTANVTGGKLEVGKGDKRLVDVEYMPINQLMQIELYPDVREELVAGIQDDFMSGPYYIGNLWKEQK